MAILPAIPGLGVSILVRGTRAVEYDDPDQEEGTVGADVTADFDIPQGSANLPVPHAVKYIEAEPDAPFSIRVVKTPDFQRLSHNIGCRLLIDGQSGIFVDEGYDGTPQELWMATFNSQYSGSETAGWKRHKFVFSALRLVEGAGPSGAADKHQASLLEGCGTLKLLFYHMDWCCVDWNSPWGTARPPDLGPAELSEKQLKGKAIDCSASFATEAASTPPMPKLLRGFNDPLRRPFAVFEFRYRLKEGLMREGVIPRPIPVVEEVVEEAVQDPIHEGQTRQFPIHIKEEKKPVPVRHAKRELADVQFRPGVKREPVEHAENKVGRGRGYKQRRLANGRMQIDLTDD